MDEFKSRLAKVGLAVDSYKQARSPKGVQFYSVDVPINEAVTTWHKVKENFKEVSWYPVLLDDEEELAILADLCDRPITPMNIPGKSESTQQDFFAPVLKWLGEPADSKALTKRTGEISTGAELMSSLRERFPNMAPELKELLIAGLEKRKPAVLNQMIDAICSKDRSAFEKLTFAPSQELLDLRKYERSDGTISTIQEFIDVGELLDPTLWLRAREKADRQHYSCPLGTWPVVMPESKEQFQVGVKRNGRKLSKVLLLLLPNGVSWHVPALLHFGKWHGCPPQAHVAVLKYWYEQFGAEVISIRSDTVELSIDKPIRTKEEALKVAHDHFIYCSDVVLQGFGELAPFAASLLNARRWSFWWD